MVEDSADKPGFVLGFDFSNDDSVATTGSKSVLGAALLESAETLSTAQVQAVSNAPDFGLVLLRDPITNIGSSPSYSGPIWGWTDGAQTNPLLLTESAYSNGDIRLQDGADYYDTAATTPNQFNYGFQLKSSSVTTFVGDSNTTLAAYGVNWGLWDGSNGDTAKVYDGTGLQNTFSQLDAEVAALLISAEPAFTGSNLTGNVRFDSVASFIGINDANQPIRDVDGGFELDLGTGIVTGGSLDVCFGASGDTCTSSGIDKWSVSSFSGSLASANRGLLDSVDVTGSISGSVTSTFTGDLYGFMVEDSADKPGFVLGFEFENVNPAATTGSKSLLGGALLEGKYLQTFDSAFIAPYTGFGFALSKGITTLTAEFSAVIGNATHSNSGNPSVISFFGNGTDNSPADFFNSDPQYILKGNASTRNSSASIIDVNSAETSLNWSFWNNSSSNILYDDISSGFNESTFTDDLLIVTSTSPAFKTTGTYTFADTTQTRNFTAIASNGTLDALTGSFDVDFASGNVNNGILQLDLSGTAYDQSWTVNFSGTFSTLFDSQSTPAPHLSYLEDATIDSSNIVDDYDGTATGHTISGSIVGILTTLTNGSPGFAGGFNLVDAANSSNSVLGAFLWGNDDLLTSQERIGMSSTSGVFVTSSAKNGDLSGIFGGPAYSTATPGQEIFTNRSFSDSTFGNKLNLLASQGTVENIYRSGDTTASSAASTNGLDRWGKWQSATIGTNAFNLHTHSATGTSSSAAAGDVGYWFLGDPIDADDVPTSGSFTFGGTGIGSALVALQGSYSHSGSSGANTPAYLAIDADSGSQFSFDITFTNGGGTISNGLLNFTAGGETVTWTANFDGTLVGAFLNASINGTGTSNYIYDINGNEYENTDSSMQGQIQGYFTGSSTVEGAALAFNLSASTNDGGTKNALFGTVLLGAGAPDIAELTLPNSTAEDYSIAWGKWDNPINENWLVIEPNDSGSVQIQTSEHLALVNPTPIANLTGTGNYETTIASSFIGSGNAGDVTQVVAGMAVDFDSGLIANGLLQVEVANTQAWQIDFTGTVNAGLVELNATSGLLMDPGGVLSNSIEANLGGVFTGNYGEAFVGGFELVDQINSLNQVNGLYTIER